MLVKTFHVVRESAECFTVMDTLSLRPGLQGDLRTLWLCFFAKGRKEGSKKTDILLSAWKQWLWVRASLKPTFQLHFRQGQQARENQACSGGHLSKCPSFSMDIAFLSEGNLILKVLRWNTIRSKLYMCDCDRISYRLYSHHRSTSLESRFIWPSVKT